MKNLTPTFLAVLLSFSFIGVCQETHQATVTGIIPLGGREVAAIRDLETDCVYKTSPFENGFLHQSDILELLLNAHFRRAEIKKDGLRTGIYAFDDGCSPGNPAEREIFDCEPIPSLEIITQPNPGEEHKYDKVLKSLAVGLIDLTKDAVFCQQVNGRCEEQFDGDDNVLFRDMETTRPQIRTEIESAQQKYRQLMPNGQGVWTSYVNTFPYYNGYAYPHIFIPFIDQVDHSLRPIIAINYNDDEVLEGYELITHADGSETVNEISITESMARSRPVWVIAVNERVNNDGNPNPQFVSGNGCPPGYQPVPYNAPPSCSNGIQDGQETGVDCGGPDCPPCETCTDGLQNGQETGIDCGGPDCPACQSSIPPDVGLRIDELWIHDKKEGWGNGRADIRWKGFQYEYCSAAGYEIFANVNPEKISNAELQSWQPLKDPIEGYIAGAGGKTKWELEWEELWFIVYEEDRRNKFADEYKRYPSSCPQATLSYISKEPIYGVVFLNPFDFTDAVTAEYTHTQGIDSSGDPNKIKIRYWKVL